MKNFESKCPCGVISHSLEEAFEHEDNCPAMQAALEAKQREIDGVVESSKADETENTESSRKYKYVNFVCAACGARFDNRKDALRHDDNCEGEKPNKKSEAWEKLRKIANIPNWDDERKKWKKPVKYYD